MDKLRLRASHQDILGVGTSPATECRDASKNQFRGRVLARSLDSPDFWSGANPHHASSRAGMDSLHPNPFLSHSSHKAMFQAHPQQAHNATGWVPGSASWLRSSAPKASTISSAASCTGYENRENLEPTPMSKLLRTPPHVSKRAALDDTGGQPPMAPLGGPEPATPFMEDHIPAGQPAARQPLAETTANLPEADSDSEISATSLQESGNEGPQASHSSVQGKETAPEPESCGEKIVTPRADSSQGAQSSQPMGLLDHLLKRTPHLLPETDRDAWQLKSAKADLQASQQQARGLGLALRREAGVRRGIEGALATLHYEAAALERLLEEQKSNFAGLVAALTAMLEAQQREDAATSAVAGVAGHEKGLKDKLRVLLHQIREIRQDSLQPGEEAGAAHCQDQEDAEEICRDDQAGLFSSTQHGHAGTDGQAAVQPCSAEAAEDRLQAIEDLLRRSERSAGYLTPEAGNRNRADATADHATMPHADAGSASQALGSTSSLSKGIASQLASPCSQDRSPATNDLHMRLRASQLNEAALEAEVAGLWARLNQQGAALSAVNQEQHSNRDNAAERESELLAQLDAVSLKLQAAEAAADARARAHEREVQRLAWEGAQQRSLLQARIAELQAVMEGALQEATTRTDRADTMASPMPFMQRYTPSEHGGNPHEAADIAGLSPLLMHLPL
ncbi:hypothetical protein WJX73_002361 [Symbiochloris irregularis]|uniref:Uncharacterized protein n=1 Tax=Symbiochloris irregularis TaxID=706552 RepID=A0AAW1P972_9CHLO